MNNRTLNLQTKILDCLKRAADKNPLTFMSYEDIAYDLWGNGHTPASWRLVKHGLIDMVKQRMYFVRQLADENTLMLIPNRPSSKKDKRVKSNHVVGWKIAVRGYDDEYVIDEWMYKKKHVDAREKSLHGFVNNVKKQNMLPETAMKQLVN
jgi:hypothetical protein